MNNLLLYEKIINGISTSVKISPNFYRDLKDKNIPITTTDEAELFYQFFSSGFTNTTGIDKKTLDYFEKLIIKMFDDVFNYKINNIEELKD